MQRDSRGPCAGPRVCTHLVSRRREINTRRVTFPLSIVVRSPEPGRLRPASPQAERPPCRKLQVFGVPWTVVWARVPSYYQTDATGRAARPIAETKDLQGSGWGMGRRLLAHTRDGRGELQRLEWQWGHPRAGVTPVHYGKAAGRPNPSPTRLLFVKFFFLDHH